MTLVTTATELPRIMQCIGSRLMPKALPDDYNTEQRDEGNAAHWLAQQLFNGEAVGVGSKAYNGYIITDEMMEHVREYLGALDAGEMEIETTFSGEGWEVRGRADHLVYRADCGRMEYINGGNGNVLESPMSMLTVDDFKYGRRLVEPDENWTLLAHAIGWCIRNNIQPDHIVLRIHQPRAYHPKGTMREWEVPGGYSGLAERYQTLQRKLSNPTSELVTSLSQCAKCHALATCPAARTAGMNAIDAAQDVAFVDDLPNDALAREYEMLDQAAKMVEMVRDARKELMEHRLGRGQMIPGWHLKQRLGQRAWPAWATGRTLSAMAGVDLTKDGIVTPAEAERRGVPKKVLEGLTTRPSLGVKLERLDADAVGRRLFGERTGQ